MPTTIKTDLHHESQKQDSKLLTLVRIFAIHWLFNDFNKKLELSLIEKTTTTPSYIRLIIILLIRIWPFGFSCTLCVGFLANLLGNGCTRVYKHCTHNLV